MRLIESDPLENFWITNFDLAKNSKYKVQTQKTDIISLQAEKQFFFLI